MQGVKQFFYQLKVVVKVREHKRIGTAGRYGNLEISHPNNLSEKELRFRGNTFLRINIAFEVTHFWWLLSN